MKSFGPFIEGPRKSAVIKRRGSGVKDGHYKKRFVTTRGELQWNEKLQRFETVNREGYWYEGPWALAHTNADWESQDYRIYQDNSGEALGSETAYENENTDRTGHTYTDQVRLRFNWGEDAAADSNNSGTVKLQYNVDGAGWNDITTTTTDAAHAIGSNNTGLTDGDADSTERLSGMTGTTFDATWSELCEDGASNTSRTYSDKYTEFTFVVGFHTSAQGSTITFRVVLGDGTVPTPAGAIASIGILDGNLVIDDGLAVDAPVITESTPDPLINSIVQGRVGSMHMGNVGLLIRGITPTVTVGGGGDLVIDDGLAVDPLVITGNAPTAEEDHYRNPSLDTLVITENTPTRLVNETVSPGLDTLVITETTPSAEEDHYRNPGLDALVITENTPTRLVNETVSPGLDALVITENQPSAEEDHYRNPGLDTLVITELTPTRFVEETALPALDTLVITELQPSIPTNPEPDLDTLVITGNAPTAEEDHYRNPGLDSLVITESTPDPLVNHIALPAIDTLVITENQPSAEEDHYRNPGLDALVFTGIEPTAKVTILRQPDADSLSLSGETPEITRFVDPTIGSISITELTPDPLVNHIVQPGLDTLVITEQTPTRLLNETASPALDALVITELTPDPLLNHIALPAIDELSLTGNTPEISRLTNPSIDTLTFSGEQPTALVTLLTQPGKASLVISGITPTRGELFVDARVGSMHMGNVGLLIRGITPTATVSGGGDLVIDDGLAPDALVITENTPTRLVAETVAPSLDALIISGQTPVRLVGKSVAPTIDTLVITETTPTLAEAYYRSPALDALTLSGKTPTSTLTITIEVGGDTLTFSSEAPTPEFTNKTALPAIDALNLAGLAPSNIFANSGTAIVNANATTDVPNNYEQCDFSGFRQLPGSLKMTWNRHAVRRKSWDERHPQLNIRSVPERQRGPKRPEQNDNFIDDLYPSGVDPEDL
jgi:hypothetical protein